MTSRWSHTHGAKPGLKWSLSPGSRHTTSDRDVQDIFDEWQTQTTHLAVRARRTVATVSIDERPQLNALTVVVRALRALTQDA
jgi:hypothetical protein